MDSSDTDDDLGLIPVSDFSDESDETKSVNSNRIGNVEYEFLTTSDLICEMENNIVNVSTALHVNGGTAKFLLNKFKWNAKQLVDNYHDATDLRSFFQSLNIDGPRSDIASSAIQPPTQCEICLTSLSNVTKMINFHCGHQFCEICCGEYFKAKVLNEGVGSEIKCPDIHCDMLIDDATVIKFIPDNVAQQLLKLITRAFVASNPLLQHCPSEVCEYTIKANTLEPVRVICKCGFESCFQCGEIWHDAITCVLLRKWIRVCVDDLENEEWLKENTKKCPRCTFNIEKLEGCNHVHCQSCNHHFCWICKCDWYLHITCSKFEDEDITTRLMHYSTRYMNHIRSLKLELGIYDSVVSKMPFLTSEEVVDATSPDIVMLKRAVRTLRRSRQILTSTYVFAYYSVHCNQLAIFEDNQSDLERATENLSWLLERDISIERWGDVQQKLVEKYVYCDKRCRVLLDHINEGYEKNYWNLKND